MKILALIAGVFFAALGALRQLIDKAQRKLEQLEAQRKLVLKDDDYEFRLLDIEYEILSDLIKNYKELVNRYVVDLALFEWPKLLLDKNNPET